MLGIGVTSDVAGDASRPHMRVVPLEDRVVTTTSVGYGNSMRCSTTPAHPTQETYLPTHEPTDDSIDPGRPVDPRPGAHRPRRRTPRRRARRTRRRNRPRPLRGRDPDEVYQATLQALTARVEREPAFERIAGAVFRQRYYREVLDEDLTGDELDRGVPGDVRRQPSNGRPTPVSSTNG